MIAIKTMLSTPKTISKKIRVIRLIHASGVKKIDKSNAFSFLAYTFMCGRSIKKDSGTA